MSTKLHGLCELGASLMLAALFAGCAGSSEHSKRSHFSNATERLVGHGIRPGASTTNSLPPDVDLSNGLTENEAVAVALWNNALFQENLTKLHLARADVAQAGLLSNPTFSMLFPLGPKQLEFAATFPLEAVWLRPRRIAIAQIDAERIAASLLQNGLDLVRDVRVSFSDLGLIRERLKLSTEAVALRERIVQISEARQRAGEAPDLETLAAHVELMRAHDDSQRLTQESSAAEHRLQFLVGLNDQEMPVAHFSTPVPTRVTNSLDDLQRRAMAARPDLRACELAVEVAAKRAGLAKTEFLTLSGVIDANGSGAKGFEMGPGLQLPIPLFNQNQSGRVRAAAELERASWSCIGMQQRIRLEVQEAYSKYQQAAEASDAYRTQLLPAVEELSHRSEKAFQLGEMPPLAVQENARQLLAARVREAELLADVRRARAELERSAGTPLHDGS